jgi:hypothetical protein
VTNAGVEAEVPRQPPALHQNRVVEERLTTFEVHLFDAADSLDLIEHTVKLFDREDPASARAAMQEAMVTFPDTRVRQKDMNAFQHGSPGADRREQLYLNRRQRAHSVSW